MSEYQDFMTQVIVNECKRTVPYIDFDKSTYETERTKYDMNGKLRRNDLVIHLEPKHGFGSSYDVCIEIKRNVADLHSGYGLGFNEEFNFIAFVVNSSVNGPIRMKHIQEMQEDGFIDKKTGILAVFPDGSVVCVREAAPMSCPECMMHVFSIRIGKTPQEFVEGLIG